MQTIEFENLNTVDDALLKYAVIVSQYQGKWVYCKHKERQTWEIPGGRREPSEAILNTAKRELVEETGALDFALTPVCVYSVIGKTKSYGLLCYADIKSIGTLPESEIELIRLFEDEPSPLTYPQIQPYLFNKIKQLLAEQ